MGTAEGVLRRSKIKRVNGNVKMSTKTSSTVSAAKTEKSLVKPSASYSITLRLKIKNVPGSLGKITSLIGEEGGDIGAIDIAGFEKNHILRDVTVNVRDEAHGEEVIKALKRL